MKHVLIIKPDCTLKLRRWPKREEQLDFLQELVGGYIETVRTGTPGVIMVINEEGRITEAVSSEEMNHLRGMIGLIDDALKSAGTDKNELTAFRQDDTVLSLFQRPYGTDFFLPIYKGLHSCVRDSHDGKAVKANPAISGIDNPACIRTS